MRDTVRWTLTGGSYGVGLLLWAFLAAGAGHGSYLPFALAAAPFSTVFPFGFLAAPVLWGAIAYALARRWTHAVLVVLAMHIAGAAFSFVFGTRAETAGEQWESLTAPWAFVLVWPGLAAYACGVLAATHAALEQRGGHR